LSASLLDIGVEHVLDDLLRQPAHPRDGGERLHRRRLRQRDGPLGDVGGVVADALEVARDLERRHDLAQVARHRLAQRQDAHG
jgi:hypothetical protein